MFLSGAVLAFAAAALAAAPPLPAGKPLLPPDSLAVYAAGFDLRDPARVELVPAAGAPFARSVRVTTLRRPGKTYGVQLSARTVAAVEEGDTLLARFYVRSASPAKALMEFVFERAGADYRKSSVLPVQAGPVWRRVDHVFKAKGSYAPGEAQVNFRLGFDPQVVELGGIEVLRLDHPTAGVSATAPSYAGRDRYAPWRAAAEERIERRRKGDLTVTVRDAAGRPAAGVPVRARMLRHAFGFGGAVSARYLQSGPDTPNKRRYRAELLRLFNRAVIDNALKWSQWDRQKDWGLRTAAWLAGSGIEVRGHNLVWPGWSHLPEDLEGLPADELRRRVEDHIREAASLLRGRVREWDVLNEPYDNRDVTEILGRESLVDWFRLARKADPEARLYVNEAGILSRSGEDRSRQDGYDETIRFLLGRGAPLDGIGLQAHFDLRLTPPPRLLEILDRFARFGKPLQVTELDLDFSDEGLQADYLRDFMTACFSHPAVDGIVLWEFWEGLQSGSPEAAVLFRKDWSRKPSGAAWEDLVFRRWWTDARGATDARGRFKVRGFLGSYEVEAGGKAAKVELTRDGAEVSF